MSEKQNSVEERKSFSIVVKNKDIEIIQGALKEVESMINIPSDIDITQKSYRTVPGLEVFLLTVSMAFLNKFAERFGENMADWLTRKLELHEKSGEKIIKNS